MADFGTNSYHTYISNIYNAGMSRAISENYYQKETAQLPVKWSSPGKIM